MRKGKTALFNCLNIIYGDIYKAIAPVLTIAGGVKNPNLEKFALPLSSRFMYGHADLEEPDDQMEDTDIDKHS